MFTMRLRNLQHPSEAEKLLEAYVADSGILPKDALQICERAELPKELRSVPIQATRTGKVWAPGRITSAVGSQRRRCPDIIARARNARAAAHSLDGEIATSGCWMVDQKGKWHRCAD
jgi:hypothetical protein